ncbi:hypothetical protein EBS02_11600, partial [bacterium]|nr:hypothetical protein [bacterium]
PESSAIESSLTPLLMWSAVGALLRYVIANVGSSHVLKTIKQYTSVQEMYLDNKTRLHLELDDHTNPCSLITLIDHTQTAMGARLLKRWMKLPTRDLSVLNQRHIMIDSFLNNDLLMKTVHDILVLCPDIQRLASKILTKTIRPRELVSLATAMTYTESLEKALSAYPYLNCLPPSDSYHSLYQLIQHKVLELPAALLRDGPVMNPQCDEELNHLRRLADDQASYLKDYEYTEQKELSFAIKACFNHIHGFYFEVSKLYADQVPPHFTRIQTLKSVERYTTPTLRSFESQVLKAKTLAFERERVLWLELIEELQTAAPLLKELSDQIALLDVTLGFAQCALRYGLTQPSFTQEPGLSIKEGRHLVIETLNKKQQFIPNDLVFNEKHR